MATTLFLIRHAAHDRVDSVLCGRMAGVGLGPAGHRQAQGLAQRLRREAIEFVYTSPLERARETAAHLAPPRISAAMTELDFGAWTGRGFAELADDPAWRRWNAARDQARPPGGESMREAQARAVDGIRLFHAHHRDRRLAVVSHGEIIRAVVMACLGLPLDAWARLEISPASVTVLAIWGDGDQGRVLCLNETLPT